MHREHETSSTVNTRKYNHLRTVRVALSPSGPCIIAVAGACAPALASGLCEEPYAACPAPPPSTPAPTGVTHNRNAILLTACRCSACLGQSHVCTSNGIWAADILIILGVLHFFVQASPVTHVLGSPSVIFTAKR